MSCLFCQMINGEIPIKKVYEDDDVLAFYDIDPKAPFHCLVIPKKHISSLNKVNEENAVAISKCFLAIKKIAKEYNLDKGYRVVSNCGEDAGQTVPHIHFHVLGKRLLAWPPG